MPIQDLLKAFARAVKARLQPPCPGDPEEQLKIPVERLLVEFGSARNCDVQVRMEARVEGLGRPDAAVHVNGALVGYVELKRPDEGANPRCFRGRNQEQWGRFQRLPNLLYTNGQAFYLCRREKVVLEASLDRAPAEHGARAVSPACATQIEQILQAFISWEPVSITDPKVLATELAPLCHLLRSRAQEALAREDSILRRVAQDWRSLLFPDANDAQFADAYAQTFAYALLLARLEGSGELQDVQQVALVLRRGHRLLGDALLKLGDPAVLEELSPAPELLERTLEAVDEQLRGQGADLWLNFYEDFLAAYDPRLRKDRGVYYTPLQVVGAQVRLVEAILKEDFDKALGFADENVIVLDPAVGTGTYLLRAFERGEKTVRDAHGDGAVPAQASRMAANMHGFEVLVGPYTVAHLRMTQAILKAGGRLPDDGVRIYLTDALASPTTEPPTLHDILAEEQRRAQRVKRDVPVLVCIGNPPYDREQIEQARQVERQRRKGGWVRYGEEGQVGSGILEDFLAPAREAGAGVHLKNLYNDYVYFWRWALWKVFEQSQGPGIVAFITASSYLRGPGFVGMRKRMRELLDEIWILDLEGDGLGPRKTENVFDIRTPVAIAIAVRYGEPRPDVPAEIHYSRITGTREEKYATLDGIQDFDSLEWQDGMTGWTEPFLPQGTADYFTWPLLTDLFPWQHSGVQAKRTWIMGSAPGVLEVRWKALLRAPDRRASFRETTDRRIHHAYGGLTPLADLQPTAPNPQPVRYAYRSFDRQWCLLDVRLADRPRPSLWAANGERQVYLTSLLTTTLGSGPAATSSAHVPDLHHFRGSFGAKDVIPLWRDAEATDPNVTSGLLDFLRDQWQRRPTPEDLFTYAYALLANAAFTDRFSDELVIPGPRVPLTRDPDLFARVAVAGRELLWLHTFGNRFIPAGCQTGQIPQGSARNTLPIPDNPAGYPDAFEYDETRQVLRVGAGEFEPVPAEVWAFQVSGLQVVRSWLGYRMKVRAGRRSSPLDEIGPESWTPDLTGELLELLWVLEATVDRFPALEALLEEVCAGEVFRSTDLPQPTDAERKAPADAAPRQVPGLF